MDTLASNWYQLLADKKNYGMDISFLPDFELLQNEINKSTSLHDCGPTDWSLVISLSDKILSNESKDLWVFMYGIAGHYHKNGLLAFATTLSNSIDFIAKHWEGLYPQITKKQRRLASFLWLQTQIKQWNNQSRYQNTDSSVSKFAATQALTKLESFLSENFDNAPVFTSLMNQVLQTNANTKAEEDIAQDDDTSNLEQNIQQDKTVAITTQTPEHMQVESKTSNLIPKIQQSGIVRDIIDNGRKLATHILSQNNFDERGFLLHRSAIWGTLLQLPPSDSNGKTQLSCGIPQDKLQEYQSSFENRQYRDIIYPLEISTGKSPFWLDGHYMVARCLEELKADLAYQVLKVTFIQLINRFPALLNYTFGNGMPFASSAVHDWYHLISREEVFIEKPLSFEKEIMITNSHTDILQEAILLSKEQNFHVGLRHLGKASSGRNKSVFTLGILQAKYCIQLHKTDIALQLLESLYFQLKDWEMLDWEPELTVQILSLLLSCKAKDSSKDSLEQKRLLYRLNLDAALNLTMLA